MLSARQDDLGSSVCDLAWRLRAAGGITGSRDHARWVHDGWAGRGRASAAGGGAPSAGRLRADHTSGSRGRIACDGRAGHDCPPAASRRTWTTAGMRLQTMSCLAARLRCLGASRVLRHGHKTPRRRQRPPGGLEVAGAPVAPMTVRRTTCVHWPHESTVPSPGARRWGRVTAARMPRRCWRHWRRRRQRSTGRAKGGTPRPRGRLADACAIGRGGNVQGKSPRQRPLRCAPHHPARQSLR